MKSILSIGTVLQIFFLVCATNAMAADDNLPVIDGKKIVATVNDEPITLEELNQSLADAHADMPGKREAGRIDYSHILNRLITTRLIVLEARNMGLDELPEVQNEIAAYGQQLLMEILLERHVSDIRANADEVAESYAAIVKEWKIQSVRLKKKTDALKVESWLNAGQDFDKVARKVIEWDIGDADLEGVFVQNKDLTPPIAQMVSKMKMGSTSPMMSIGKRGYIIFRLEDARIPRKEDPQAMALARRQALNEKKVRAAKAYTQELIDRHIKSLNQELLDALDYEAPKPGFDSLLKDKRTLVDIRGEKAITVGEFSRAIDQKFYHGLKRAIENKRINSKKQQVLEEMIQKRVLRKEALEQGIGRTAEYESRAKTHEIQVLFGTFINKVVAPNIKLDEKDLEVYYKRNSKSFTTPQMIRIKSLVFGKRDDAVSAINKLKKGTDFSWLGSNAEGQINKDEKGLLNFDGRLLTQSGLPRDVQETVSNAKPGDFKLYESPQGHFYVLAITQIAPPKPEPFDAVKKDIAEKVFNEKIKDTIEQWAEQLKDYYPVKIYKKN